MPNRSTGLRLWAALGTLYVVWGSTYLGIAIAIETIPPFLMLTFRFAIAGAVLLAWEIARGGLLRARPTRRQVRDAAIVGALLLGIGNGFVAYGELTVASGIAAVLIALMPVWLAFLGWVYFRERLPIIVVVAIVLGLVGVAVLVWPAGSTAFELAGIGALILSPVGWAHGSLFSAHAADLPRRPLTSTAIQMLAGSLALLVESAVTGEFGQFHPSAISLSSVTALAYLTVIGSLLAFNAYAWLLRNAPLSLVGTYAYVNPVVAVGLGAIFLSEPITPRTLLASAVIVAAVAMIVTFRGRAGRAAVSRRSRRGTRHGVGDGVIPGDRAGRAGGGAGHPGARPRGGRPAGRGAGAQPAGRPSALTVRATRLAKVMTVSMGLTPSPVGNVEVSATYNPGMTRPSASRRRPCGSAA